MRDWKKNLISRCCREADWDNPVFRNILQDLQASEGLQKYRQEWHFTTHDRKDWEWAFITEVLANHGMLQNGKRGIGFAVGKEPLPAYFASKGVDILASDLSAEDPGAKDWLATKQNAGSAIESLFYDGLCSRKDFDAHIRYRDINMNAIPRDVAGYDFAWSSCAIEHVGSLEKSKTFLKNVMNVLKTGGVSVHTTEYNLSSNDKTLESGVNVIWRRKDVEEIQSWMQEHGHRMIVSFERGNRPSDRYVDTPPFRTKNPDAHLCLQLEKFASTSFAFVIQKGLDRKPLWVVSEDATNQQNDLRSVRGSKEISIRNMEKLLVYGVGEHLHDMLAWHPELGSRIGRLFDKNKKKIGQKMLASGIVVESPEALDSLPEGTQIVISAIRYYDEIRRELTERNPGLVCISIDDAYTLLQDSGTVTVAAPTEAPAVVPGDGMTDLQRQRLKGLDAANRWRRDTLMRCAQKQLVFWGTRGRRAIFFRRAFMPMMGNRCIFIDSDPSQAGKMIDGLPVCLPEVLKDMLEPFVIIVLTEDYDAVRATLSNFGYIENVNFVEGRRLLGEDENGSWDIPQIDKQASHTGMIVYGSGAHLHDMLAWHPELAERILRVIDKDPAKAGERVSGVGVQIESPGILRNLPAGTEIAISAIRYLKEITGEILALNAGLSCKSIDDVWQEYVSPVNQESARQAKRPSDPQELLHENRYEALMEDFPAVKSMAERLNNVASAVSSKQKMVSEWS